MTAAELAQPTDLWNWLQEFGLEQVGSLETKKFDEATTGRNAHYHHRTLVIVDLQRRLDPYFDCRPTRVQVPYEETYHIREEIKNLADYYLWSKPYRYRFRLDRLVARIVSTRVSEANRDTIQVSCA